MIRDLAVYGLIGCFAAIFAVPFMSPVVFGGWALSFVFFIFTLTRVKPE